ncbi:DUF262 domain-containing protein [Candidatus Poriferisodalis sp.]|uniref:DUF262 domain-containing protein n=1 Tax=Candidatus Poriferisodalis sp. TaxID=3101277 RepID=UPI003B01AB59
MKADTLTLKSLFQKDVRYVIPTFQRPYVWNQEDQWEPLWNDVRNAAERYLDELALAEGHRPKAEEQTGTHFMGAVVLQQQLTAVADIETRLVIDGQQRLTTAQILLDAAQEVFEELGAVAEAKRISRLVLNAFADGDEAFKLWPTSLDRDPFRAAMKNGAPTAGHEDSLIVQAHDFFRLQIREWISASVDEADQEQRAHGLEAAMFGLLEVVVIDLATADDAFVIFETLNARGTPLLASDLVKNYVLQTATAVGLDAGELHERDWLPFEDSWWRQEIRQGRIVRPRLDVFLNYWLIMETASEVQSQDVFPRFKLYAEDQGKAIAEIVGTVRDIGETYKSLERENQESRIETFLYRWRTVDAGTLTPLLLWLFSRPEHVVGYEQRLQALGALESYLVRRMICRMTTKDYNRLFLELMAELREAEPGEAAESIVAFLAEQTSESRRWPTDGDVEHAILDLPLYRLLTRRRLRMVLEAIEDECRSVFSEEANVARGSLTIEHVMPQSWSEHWPLGPVQDVLQAQHELERLVHSLGNLTLVNHRLNPALSNRPWAQKQETLDDHTVLHLNKDLLNAYKDADWTEATVAARGASLAAVVTRIWPAP